MSTRANSCGGAFWGDVDDDVALKRYQTLVNTIDDGIYQLDAGGRFVAVNDVIVETTGYARDELLGERASLVLSEDDVERVEREITTQIESRDDRVATFELAVQTAAGGAVPCELRVNLLIEEGAFQGTIGVARDVSEKKRRQETVESTRESYDSIVSVLNEADIGVFVLDDEFDVGWVNEAVERYFGLDRDELVGRNKRRVDEAIQGRVDDSERFAERVLATYDDNSYVEQFECRVTAGEGRTERWLEHYSKPIESGRYAGGRLELYYDITDRKRSKDALHETEERFQSLVDAVEEYAIFRLDSDGRVITWNDGAAEIKGYDRDEILGEHFSTFYTETDRAAGVPGRNLERATEAGSVEDEGWRVRTDGSRFWANVTITPVRDDDGTHRGYLKVTRDMTDRYERERELESELRRVFGRISDAFYAVDRDFRITHVNERAEELLRRSEDELLGERLWDVFPSAAEIDEVWDAFQTAMNSQEATSYELHYDTLGFWVEANLYPSETGISVYFRDVTERKERERELEQYRTIVETIDDGVYVVDDESRFRLVNGAHAELTGYDREELLGAHASLVTDGDYVGLAEDARDRLRTEDAAATTIETEIVTSDGERIPVETRFSLLSLDEGRDGRVGVVRDISKRKEHERALEESERRYRTLVENFPNGSVGLYDEELTYTVVGGEVLDELGVSPDDVVGTTIHERYPDDLVDEIEPYFGAVFDGESNAFEIDVGDRHLLAHTLPVRNADDEIYAGMLMVQDITERREYRRKLEESNERLEQFASLASHDLQEPLRMITSYLHLIEKRYGDELGEDGAEFLEFAVDGAERMREIIDGLLEYSRVETRGDPFESVDLTTVLEDVREDLQVRIEESDAEIATGRLPLVEGDRSQLRQVFQNLLSNAIAYSGDDPPRIEVSAERDGDQWVVSVRDEGIGVDPDDQGRIFEAFKRLHSHDEHPGTGIGLALCRRIVERHGGEIWLDSEPGEGSTFSVRLPAARSCDT